MTNSFRRRFRPHLEQLESRRVLATILVTSALDDTIPDGQVTLREAIEAANTNQSVDGSLAGDTGVDTIQFDPAINGTTIVLAGSELMVSESLVIEGNGADTTAISGGGQSRIFHLLSSSFEFTHFEFRGVSLLEGRVAKPTTGAADEFGGAILLLGQRTSRLVIRDSLIAENEADNGGGLHAFESTVLIERTTFTGNLAAFGAAMSLQSVQAAIVNSTIDSNVAQTSGGGIDHLALDPFRPSTLDLVNVTLTDNAAPFGRNLRNSSQSADAIVRYRNSIIAGGEGGADFLNDVFLSTGSAITVSLGHNVLDFTPSNDTHPTDLNLQWVAIGIGPLALSGGSVPTRALHPLSVGVDGGSNALAMGPGPDRLFGTEDDVPLLTDQRSGGFARVVDAGSGSATVDIGAHELQTAITIPENLVVTSAADEPFRSGVLNPSDLQLREAVQLANLRPGPDVVRFSPSFDSSTIILAGSQIRATDSVEILGPGADRLVISGAGKSRIFSFGIVDSGGLFVVDGLTLADGNGFNGGAIYAKSNNLIVRNSVLRNNVSTRDGGGLFGWQTDVDLISTTFAANQAARNGGGASLVDSKGSIVNATFSANRAENTGGGLAVRAGRAERMSDMLLTSSTFANNSSPIAADVDASAHESAGLSDLRIANSIFASTVSVLANVVIADPVTRIVSLGRNIAADQFLSDPHPSDLVNTDARLAPLQTGQAGIPTHTPLIGSPARDNGNADLLPSDQFDIDGDENRNEPLPLDAHGNGRLFDLSSAVRADSIMDIGAVEVGSESADVFDYGDAPDPSFSTLGATAPRHRVGDLFLGTSIDADLDGLPTAGADGDGSDDDGIEFVTSLLAHPTLPTTAGLNVTASGSGILDGWIDFNADGDWADPGEHVVNAIAVEAGQRFVAIEVPPGASATSTFARFRINSVGSLPADSGSANDGEIEDYQLELIGSGDVLNVDIPIGSVLGILQGAANFVIAADDVVIFSAPPLDVASVRLSGTDGNDILRVSDLSGVRDGRIPITVDAKAGEDQLIVSSLVDTPIDSQFDLVEIETATFDVAFENQATISPIIAAAAGGNTAMTLDVDNTNAIVQDDGWRYSHSTILFERFARVVEAMDFQLFILGGLEWTNPVEPHDVDNSGTVSSLDALIVINQLTTRRFVEPDSDRLVSASSLPAFPDQFYDASEDDLVTALDALRIINFLARQQLSQPSAEQAPSPHSTDDDTALQMIQLPEEALPVRQLKLVSTHVASAIAAIRRAAAVDSFFEDLAEKEDLENEENALIDPIGMMAE